MANLATRSFFMKKSDLRTEYKSKRAALPQEQVRTLDLLLLGHLQSLPWDTIHYLHCFLAIEKFKEFNTTPFLRWITENYPHITLVISKSDFLNQGLTHFKYNIDVILKPNIWGIPEPVDGEEVSALMIDAIITPLLVLDHKGNRVGYGKGFYDRFFSTCRPEVLKIGVSYFEPIPSISDVSEWDIPLSLAVTPMGIYNFESR